MWPDNFEEWLELARDLAPAHLRGQLHPYPILRPFVEERIPRAIERATRWARRRRRFRGCFADRLEFARAFCGQAFTACLRRLPALAPVAACLAELPAEQRRLLLWLYADQRTFAQVAAILRCDPATARQRSREALAALRGRIALRLGEGNDAFPVFPAGAGHGF